MDFNKILEDVDVTIKTYETNESIFKQLKDVIKPSFENGPWVAGGFLVKSMFIDTYYENSGDIDVFCSSHEQVEEVSKNVSSFLDTQLEDDFADFLKNVSSARIFENETTKNFIVPFDTKTKEIQIIKKPFHNLESLLDDFDFHCCKVATDFESVIYSEKTLHDLENNILDLSKPPTTKTISRMLKYIHKYDFKPTKETIRQIYQFHESNEWKIQKTGIY